MTAAPPRRGWAWLLLALMLTAGNVQGELRLIDGWIAEPPPGSRILAGYLTLENRGIGSRSLVRVSSPQFSRVEMHRTVIVDGIARMEALVRIEIPAGGRLVMQPGADHLMLIDPATRLESGQEVELHLEFDDGSARSLVLQVQPRVQRGAPGHQHHH
ncbi:protein of unknown function DUF461 [Thioalkalivibrio nitratireducens DSM 14787]|uniref:Copper chaperone PCu(A)C n=1 Tax=Thioalkalivibrio nitratireducens (strain DSM 14787 / UNIQEM 213 / ALEN2) TaxID=1255043 RepID=L0E077_THIND|nr:copper chaperone PCu(A)C [Thioalkalivibrio nitratireducens]AGA34652.1 protein of unknown function DUF461 [Thioalkalivibrio nitratireducens DSM 14787]